MKKSTSVVHVNLEDPIAKRKNVLKTAIGATKLLYSFNEIMVLREKELRLMNKLRTTNKSMKAIVYSLNNELLPELPKDLAPKKEVHPPIHHKKKPQISHYQRGEKDDIKDLMQELKDVEKELKNL